MTNAEIANAKNLLCSTLYNTHAWFLEMQLHERNCRLLSRAGKPKRWYCYKCHTIYGGWRSQTCEFMVPKLRADSARDRGQFFIFEHEFCLCQRVISVNQHGPVQSPSGTNLPAAPARLENSWAPPKT